MEMKKLTPKEARFKDEYLIDLNATQAAIRAGFSKKTARQKGCNLRAAPHIDAAIKIAMAERSKRTQVDQDWVVERYVAIAGVDMGTYLKFDENGERTLDLADLPEGATRNISEITQDVFIEGKGVAAMKVRRTKIKLHDPLIALGQIGRHLGMFTDNVKLGLSEELRSVLDAIDGKSRGLPSEREERSEAHGLPKETVH